MTLVATTALQRQSVINFSFTSYRAASRLYLVLGTLTSLPSFQVLSIPSTFNKAISDEAMAEDAAFPSPPLSCPTLPEKVLAVGVLLCFPRLGLWHICSRAASRPKASAEVSSALTFALLTKADRLRAAAIAAVR